MTQAPDDARKRFGLRNADWGMGLVQLGCGGLQVSQEAVEHGVGLAAGAHGGEGVARQGCSGDRAQHQSGAVVLGGAGDESNAGAGGHQRGNGGPVVDGNGGSPG
jgi:hypothetical protein